jgi:hypothetical protein
MKREILVVISALAVTAALLVTPALGGKGCYGEGSHVGTTKKYDDEVAAFLEQYGDEIQAVYEAHAEKKAEIAEEIEALSKEIDEISKAKEPDLRKLESRFEKMSDLHFELTKLKFRMHKEARELVDDGADRAGFDRHFAMEMGCGSGMGAHARCSSGHATWMSKEGCHGAIYIAGKDGHADVKVLDDVHGKLGCMSGQLGDKHVEVLLDEVEDGVHRIELLIDGEDGEAKHLEFKLDDLEGNVRRMIKKMHAAPGGLGHIKRDDRRIIKNVRKGPAGGSRDFTWIQQRGSAGPF